MNCSVNNNMTSAYVKNMSQEIKAILEEQDYHTVEIDLSKISSIDSMGITFLIGIHKTAAANCKKVILTGVSETIMQLFAIMKLDSIFTISDESIG